MPAYKRKLSRGDRWYYSGQHLTVKYFSKCIYLTKSECLKAERKEIESLDRLARQPNSVNLLELINARLDYVKTKSKKYYDENHRYLKILLEALGDKSATQITKLEISKVIQAFAEELAKRGKTPHKANAMLKCFKALFAYGIDLYELDIKNPCTGLKMRAIDKKLKYIPPDSDINAVLALCDEEEKRLVEFVRDTGARIGDALKLTQNDILSEEVILFTRKARNSNLTPYRAKKPPCIAGLDFTGRVFKRWSHHPGFLEAKIKKLNQKPWNWHSLRHRYASMLSKQGKPLFEIMSLLGHSNLSTTQIYLQMLL